MSILTSILDFPLIGSAGDAQAMTKAQLEQIAWAQNMALRPAEPSIEQIMGMRNYRPPVYVPQGWADWVAMADEM